jgi:hypothetical protein
MKKTVILSEAKDLAVALIFLSLFAVGCKHDREPNKIIDGTQIDLTVTVFPAQAAQQFVLLNQASMETAITVINRLALENPSFGELTGPDGSSRYSYTRTDARFGTATFFMQFRDINGAVIDPISNRTSTATLAAVGLTGNGTSPLFTYSQAQLITLLTPGVPTSDKKVRGFTRFNGSGITDLDFTIIDGGLNAVPEGLFNGNVSAAGTGPTQPITMNFSYDFNYNVSGNIAWEGNSGLIHVERLGSGFVSTAIARYIIK